MRAPWTIKIVALAASLTGCRSPEWLSPLPHDGVTVAAIQLGDVDPSAIDPGCGRGDDNCAVEALVRRAAAGSAALVVVPEYALEQRAPEPFVGLGSRPTTPLLGRFRRLADELDIFLVINLETTLDQRNYNTQVAFDPEGTVVATHRKFELYGEERETLVPGDDVAAFDTPFGRVGLLICADIYGDPGLHEKLVDDLNVSIVAFSAMWTVPHARRWQAAFAHDWGVTLVAANATGEGGRGGGVFSPTGQQISPDGRIAFAQLPRAN
ncbi:MAG: carbon-nitrogen hydrolase family protein [Myxococcota bacterium]